MSDTAATVAPASTESNRSDSTLWLVTLGGVVLLVAGTFMSWCYARDILGNVSIYGYPGSVQVNMLILGLVALALLLLRRGLFHRFDRLLDSARGLQVLAFSALAYMLLVFVLIAFQAPGLANADPGAYVSLVGSGLMVAGTWRMESDAAVDPLAVHMARWIEILVIVVVLAIALFTAATALGQDDGTVFVLLLTAISVVVVGLVRAGLFAWIGVVADRHRHVLTLGAFAVAFLFPFTQNGSNANMSIASQVLIFATTALGLNIVVGLAGLLDLGYIAFLGAGAYTGATMSYSSFATIGWKPPFIVVMLIGAVVSATLGLVIGTPTLRVSGDYLAIVTLAFGEIFRLTMNNLDGSNGPNLTHGPNGIPAIPDLQLGSFDFGQTHTFLGVPLGRFANYYFFLLVIAAFVILVFTRLNNSRIGRGWIAIREDEKAAEAMGVNIFGLKLFAFASGAFLAGLVGTVKAHQDVSVTPDQYVFLNSAFLLAAIVLGGMGTVAGVLIGATILNVLPEKLPVRLGLPADDLRGRPRAHHALPPRGAGGEPSPCPGVPRGRQRTC